jgi:hypothetical protein
MWMAHLAVTAVCHGCPSQPSGALSIPHNYPSHLSATAMSISHTYLRQLPHLQPRQPSVTTLCNTCLRRPALTAVCHGCGAQLPVTVRQRLPATTVGLGRSHGCPSPLSAAAVLHGRRLRLSVTAVPHSCPSHPFLAAVSRGCPSRPSAIDFHHRCPSQLSATCVHHSYHMPGTAVSHSRHDARAPYGHSPPRPFPSDAPDSANPHTAAPPTAAPRTRNPRGTGPAGTRRSAMWARPSYSEMMWFVPKSGQTWSLLSPPCV